MPKCNLNWATDYVTTSLNLSDYDMAAAQKFGGGVTTIGIRRVLSEPAGEDPLANLPLPAIVASCIRAAAQLDTSQPRRRRVYERKSTGPRGASAVKRTRFCVDLSGQQRNRAKDLGKGSINRGVSEALRQAIAQKMAGLLLSELLEYASIQAKALELKASKFEAN
jgi:hypothetical protein